MSLRHLNRASLVFTVAALLTAVALCAPAPSRSAPPEGEPPPDARFLPPPATQMLVSDAADSTIAALVEGLDGDEIYAFLEKLTGEVAVDFNYGPRDIHTRISEAEGSVKAATFLSGTFESMGYAVQLQYFMFDYFLRGMHVRPGGSGVTGGDTGRPDTRAIAGIGCDESELDLTRLITEGKTPTSGRGVSQSVRSRSGPVSHPRTACPKRLASGGSCTFGCVGRSWEILVTATYKYRLTPRAVTRLR